MKLKNKIKYKIKKNLKKILSVVSAFLVGSSALVWCPAVSARDVLTSNDFYEYSNNSSAYSLTFPITRLNVSSSNLNKFTYLFFDITNPANLIKACTEQYKSPLVGKYYGVCSERTSYTFMLFFNISDDLSACTGYVDYRYRNTYISFSDATNMNFSEEMENLKNSGSNIYYEFSNFSYSPFNKEINLDNYLSQENKIFFTTSPEFGQNMTRKKEDGSDLAYWDWTLENTDTINYYYCIYISSSDAQGGFSDIDSSSWVYMSSENYVNNNFSSSNNTLYAYSGESVGANFLHLVNKSSSIAGRVYFDNININANTTYYLNCFVIPADYDYINMSVPVQSGLISDIKQNLNNVYYDNPLRDITNNYLPFGSIQVGIIDKFVNYGTKVDTEEVQQIENTTDFSNVNYIYHQSFSFSEKTNFTTNNLNLANISSDPPIINNNYYNTYSNNYVVNGGGSEVGEQVQNYYSTTNKEGNTVYNYNYYNYNYVNEAPALSGNSSELKDIFDNSNFFFDILKKCFSIFPQYLWNIIFIGLSFVIVIIFIKVIF